MDNEKGMEQNLRDFEHLQYIKGTDPYGNSSQRFVMSQKYLMQKAT